MYYTIFPHLTQTDYYIRTNFQLSFLYLARENALILCCHGCSSDQEYDFQIFVKKRMFLGSLARDEPAVVHCSKCYKRGPEEYIHPLSQGAESFARFGSAGISLGGRTELLTDWERILLFSEFHNSLRENLQKIISDREPKKWLGIIPRRQPKAYKIELENWSHSEGAEA